MNSIGAFEFLTLEGDDPRAIGQQPIILQRPGVNGTALWLTGLRAKTFKLRSCVDAPNILAARAAYLAYRNLIGSFVDMIWRGLVMTDSVTKYAVVNVTPVKETAMIGGVGGLNPPSQGWVEADWELVLVSSA